MELNLVKGLGVSHFVTSWAKYDPAQLKDKLSSSTRAGLVAFADGLLLQVNAALEQLQQYLAEDNDEPDQEALNCLEAALQALRIVALLCCEMLHECHANPPEALQTAAVQLHDHALLELGDSRPDVQDAVAKLCVTWWQYEAIDREYLVAQALPYLLARAIGSSKAGHVKACCAMKGALELLDFDDSSITDMKRMLLQAAICPAFVSRPEGRKFLASLLTVHPSMVQEMTSVIRNQIPAGRRSVLDAYGEVILRGWRDAAGPCLAEIETSLIQNLMLAAIHGSGQSLVGNIRRVLSELHRSKRLGGAGSVDCMLVRLYEPILFRSLAAANAAVRRNSLQLLLDAFPLLDPESSTEEQDELLVRQFQCLSDGLTDNCPSVRVVAAQGICTVLNLYWEIIPSATTAGYVSRLTGQLAFDGALPAVRVAVLEGLQLLVDNQHAQPVLKKTLPSLAPLMWDSSPRVREAMADLLLCISTSRGLHFWEVVPLEVLLEQMGVGSGPSDAGVHQRLHQLLVPSYFPNPQEGAARIAALLKEHPVAGQAFCRMLVAPFIHYIDSNKGCHQVQVPLEDILQLAASLMTHLLDHTPVSDPRSPPRKQRNRKGGQGGETSEAAGRGNRGKRKKAPAPPTPALEDNITAEVAADTAEADTEVDFVAVGVRDESEQSWQALLAGLAEICSGIGMALQHELCDEQDVQNMFVDDALQQLLAVCPTSAAERSVWHIAESLPCLSAVKQLLTSRMQLLAAGQLIPADVDAMAALPSSSSSSGSNAALEATAVLACLAAGSTGPKLAAMLCVGLGLHWSGASSSAVACAAASAGGPAADDPQNAEDVVCSACGHTQPEYNMLLCDGCDAGYHMTCLEPELTVVPEGDWFCPSCCGEVKACALSCSTAIQHLSLLLLSDSGRQLLQRDKLLQRALLLLQQDAASAAAAAQQPDLGADALLKTVSKALRAGVLYARAAVHVAAQAAEEQPLLLAQGYTNILQQLANSCTSLRQVNLNPTVPLSSAATQQLVPHIQLLSTLVKDTWAVLKALNGLGAYVEGAGAAVADAAGSTADIGSSLLAGLMAASRAAGDVDDTMKGILVLNTQVLKAMLKSNQSSCLPQQQLNAWLLLWLEALSNTPLAAAATAIRADIPVLVAALLGDPGVRKPGTRAAADSTSTAEGITGGGVKADEWLPALVKAAAEAEECEVQDDIQQEATDDDTAHDTENQDPNVAAPASDVDKISKVAKGRSSQQKAGLTMGLVLPPVLEAVVTAVRKHQAEPQIASRCLHNSFSKAQQEDWASSLGAFRLWCCLGHGAQELSAAEFESLKAVRHRAMEDNGTAALLLGAMLQKLLDCADAAQ